MWVSIRDGCSTQCNIYGSPSSRGTLCTITQTTAADKITVQSVPALGNSRNTSHSLSVPFSASPLLILAWPHLSFFYLSSLHSLESRPSEWISETSWQAEEQKIELKSLLCVSVAFFSWPGPPRDHSLQFHCCEQIWCGKLWQLFFIFFSSTSKCLLKDFQHERLRGMLQWWYTFKKETIELHLQM